MVEICNKDKKGHINFASSRVLNSNIIKRNLLILVHGLLKPIKREVELYARDQRFEGGAWVLLVHILLWDNESRGCVEGLQQ